MVTSKVSGGKNFNILNADDSGKEEGECFADEWGLRFSLRDLCGLCGKKNPSHHDLA
ncbi:hypothetical protein SCOR_03995 [Sulfidibacter corallicola]